MWPVKTPEQIEREDTKKSRELVKGRRAIIPDIISKIELKNMIPMSGFGNFGTLKLHQKPNKPKDAIIGAQ